METGPSVSDDALRFAEKLVALLDSGRFTATYKFATLAALIDVCVESVGPDGRPPERVAARAVGRRVLELFWSQAVPYTAGPGGYRYLRHSTQAGDLVAKLAAFREAHGLGPGAPVDQARQRFGPELAALEELVYVTVVRMPLPKLQRFATGAGSAEDRFLYDYSWPDEVAESRVRGPGFDDTLYLRPGAGEWLVRLAGVLRPIVQQRWATFVAERSADVVDVAYLDEFLFGSSRASLARVRSPLLEAQEGTCFYCGTPARAPGVEVDHFIPWARHPDSGLHNLVAAHRACNNAKRDSLAGTEHLARWLARFGPGVTGWGLLSEISQELRWPANPARGTGTARAAYLWLPGGTLLWDGIGRYAPADPSRIRALLVA